MIIYFCSGANTTSENVHKQSFNDWLGTIKVLVKESTRENPEVVTISAKWLAGYFGMSVGSTMQYYSVWNNLHPEALEALINWGDVDYKAVAAQHQIQIDPENIPKFDDCPVVQKTAMYPGIWAANKQTEAYQVRLAERILINHLRSDPPKSVRRDIALKCTKWVRQADDAKTVLEKILKDAQDSVTFNVITKIDSNQIIKQCEKMIENVVLGKLDGTLTLSGEYPSTKIQRIALRLDTIKALAHKRRQSQEDRKKKAEEVCIFLKSQKTKVFIVICVFY